MRFGLLFPLAVCVGSACNKSPLPPEALGTNPAIAGESLIATASAAGIRLENRSGMVLRVSVVDSLFFENGLASWCTGQDDCGIALAAGEARLIPPGEIVGPPPRQKAVQVLWWELKPGTPQEKAGRFERIHLRLP